MFLIKFSSVQSLSRVWLFARSTPDRMIFVHFQGKSFNSTVIQVYAPTSNAEEVEVKWLYEDLQDLLIK